MIIEVDCNNDSIEIKDAESKSIVTYKLKHFTPIDAIKMLEEILNRIESNNDFVELVKIDEDTRVTIGEW